jgi:hypothetical protein
MIGTEEAVPLVANLGLSRAFSDEGTACEKTAKRNGA